jgi:anti-anti-sigma regulatory factor
MAPVMELLRVEEQPIAIALREAGRQLQQGEGEIVIDFSAVHRIDAQALQALEELAAKADERSIKVALRGVNVVIYKVLKLTKLTSRFVFVH